MDVRVFNELFSQREEANKWVATAGVFIVLFFVFILFSVMVIKANSSVQEEVRDTIVEYKNDSNEIYEALQDEFKDDLQKWDASISKDTLSVIFHSYQFGNGSTDLSDGLKSALDDFFPRYIKICYDLRENIDEVRIEGHTDSTGIGDINQKYLYNLSLSQARTLSLLNYGFSIMIAGSDETLLDWMRKTITATGFSFSRPVLKDDVEDKTASRRVEFRILPKTATQLEKIETIVVEDGK